MNTRQRQLQIADMRAWTRLSYLHHHLALRSKPGVLVPERTFHGRQNYGLQSPILAKAHAGRRRRAARLLAIRLVRGGRLHLFCAAVDPR